ncbi:Ku protein [Rugamonas sp. CCM 8940]|uniref:non-homologous end joining protein Ku n=1 Tax=Rugamonas sp. CCM 8940 TaxID=2765359 RepID=UPI0018F6ABFB|nr:Ku protein [Rugamonas sp. CCM 8940]MBJ7313912.1 Ku protein [Rugamonas sp. CCM 8940]
MARALWKGAISFGLVYIPVELHAAVQEHELDLTMLDRRDFSPVGYKRYNKGSGADVSWDNIVKGYEYQDGDYVVLSDEDLRRANVKATQTIDILAFVDAAEVALTYYVQPYYLAPARGGEKVYALLREALRRTGKLAVATVVIRSKQHLCALLCQDDGLVLNTLRYANEIRPGDELKLPPASLKAAGISDKELKMALSLVEGMSEPWRPEQYHDSYRDDVMALVDKKIKAGQTKTITSAEPERKAASGGNVVDLVALLQKSLGGKPAKGRPAAKADAPAKAAKASGDDAASGAKKPAKPRARRAGGGGSARDSNSDADSDSHSARRQASRSKSA